MTSHSPVSISVVGAGLIGARHAAHVAASPVTNLHSIVDPDPAAAELAARSGVIHFSNLDAMLASERPDGVILATPNTLHLEQGLATLAAGLPTLIEKPIAHDVAAGEALVAAAKRTDTPLLIGHHRRHNPLVAEAKAIINSGALGRLVAAHAFFWIAKPPSYFETPWRRAPGAGPLLINFIHDIDLLRYLCGEVIEVQAFQSNVLRGHDIEDTAVVTLRFRSGALGTVTISDAIASPWSWEHTASENHSFPRTDQIFMHLGGTEASLALPRLEIWRHTGATDWLQPLSAERLAIPERDPLERQIAQFARVIRGEEPPLVTGEDGLNNLKVVEAVKRAAAGGRSEMVFA